MKLILLFLSIFLSVIQTASAQNTNDQKVIEKLLEAFLSKVDSKEMHDRFWDESLIYTSSSGERFGKEKIMGGFLNQEENREAKTTSPYTAENIDIRIFENVAILNFTLVNKPAENDTSAITYYLNSGVLKKTNNSWKVINWQATKKAND